MRVGGRSGLSIGLKGQRKQNHQGCETNPHATKVISICFVSLNVGGKFNFIVILNH
jgi:hypothetical protein